MLAPCAAPLAPAAISSALFHPFLGSSQPPLLQQQCPGVCSDCQGMNRAGAVFAEILVGGSPQEGRRTEQPSWFGCSCVEKLLRLNINLPQCKQCPGQTPGPFLQSLLPLPFALQLSLSEATRSLEPLSQTPEPLCHMIFSLGTPDQCTKKQDQEFFDKILKYFKSFKKKKKQNPNNPTKSYQ